MAERLALYSWDGYDHCPFLRGDIARPLADSLTSATTAVFHHILQPPLSVSTIATAVGTATIAACNAAIHHHNNHATRLAAATASACSYATAA